MSSFRNVLLLSTTATLLLSTARASPIAPIAPLQARAGAPIATSSIPSACSQSTVLAAPTAASAPRSTPAAALPTLYSYYLTPDNQDVVRDTPDQLFQSCLDTCFNYGLTSNFSAPESGGAKCRAAYLAFDVVNPFDEQSGPVEGSVSCLMFGHDLEEGDFDEVNGDGYSMGRAVNLGCPQKKR